MYAMVSYMDDEFSKVLSALKKKGMYKDSLIVFHSDNGGEVMGAGLCGGNNWPLTGGKFSLPGSVYLLCARLTTPPPLRQILEFRRRDSCKCVCFRWIPA